MSKEGPEKPVYPVCGAKTRRGGSCQRHPCKNGRCSLHGGKSTGPRTPEGKLRSRMGPWKHGMRTKEAMEARQELKKLLHESDALIDLVSLGVEAVSYTGVLH